MFTFRVISKWAVLFPLMTVAATEALSQPELKALPLDYGLFGGFRASPASIAEGGIVSFMNFRLLNTGSEDATTFRVSIYISDDSTLDVSDTRVWNQSIPSISAGGSMQIVVGDVTLPSTLIAGTYWYGVVVDDTGAVAESDETNNVMAGGSRLTVLAPINADLQFDLTTTSAVDWFAPFVIGVGDTYATDFGTPDSPVLIAPDGNIVFGYKVKNTGADAAPEFRVEFYLSDDNDVTPLDKYIGAQFVEGVAAGASVVAGSSKHKLPAIEPGIYYAGVIIDSENQILETADANAESNNVFVRQIKILDVASDDTMIWRVQLRLKTGNVEDARTNDSVYVMLGGEKMWLDYARDDFERNDDFTYDVMLEDVRKFADLSSLTVGKVGTNGWCLDEITLEVNGRTYFTHNFPGSCIWLDNPRRSTLFRYGRLRSDPRWGSSALPPSRLTRNDISSLIQATIGHEIHDQDLYWGHFHGDPVEVTRHSGSSVSVDLDMAADVSGWWDPDVDVDFVVNFECNCEGIEIGVSDLGVSVSSSWYPGFVKDMINDEVREGLESNVGSIGQSISTDLSFCPIIKVNQLASVEFQVPSLVADMSLALDLGAARLGEPLPVSYTVRNLGNKVPGSYTVTSKLGIGTALLPLDVSHGDDVRPCGLEEARWTRSVTLPTSASCNLVVPTRTPGGGESRSPLEIITWVSGARRAAVALALEDLPPAIAIVAPYSFTSELTADDDEITTNNKVTRGIYVTAPDVRVSALTANSDRVQAGDSVHVSGTVENIGGFATGNLVYHITLNSVTNSGTTFPVGTGILPSMSPGESALWRHIVHIPTGAPFGSYELGVRVVPTQQTKECDDENNASTVPLTVLRSPPLERGLP